MKDLRRLGRELNQVVIIDNSPMSYMFQPENAVSLSRCFACCIFVTVAVDSGSWWRGPWLSGKKGKR